jgi:hypothetical protein
MQIPIQPFNIIHTSWVIPGQLLFDFVFVIVLLLGLLDTPLDLFYRERPTLRVVRVLKAALANLV